jgi:hypothetical protein
MSAHRLPQKIPGGRSVEQATHQEEPDERSFFIGYEAILDPLQKVVEYTTPGDHNLIRHEKGCAATKSEFSLRSPWCFLLSTPVLIPILFKCSSGYVKLN